MTYNVLSVMLNPAQPIDQSPKICHLGTISQLCRATSLQLRHVSTIK